MEGFSLKTLVIKQNQIFRVTSYTTKLSKHQFAICALLY